MGGGPGRGPEEGGPRRERTPKGGPEPTNMRPRGVGPEGRGPSGGVPKGRGGPKFRAFFFPSPATIFFLPSLRGLLVEFWWCLKRQGPGTCTFEGPSLQTHQNSTRRGKKE